jgi:hypothetical protein
VPVHEVSTDETNKLLTMEQALHRRVIGQDEAITAISRAGRSRASSSPGQPASASRSSPRRSRPTTTGRRRPWSGWT